MLLELDALKGGVRESNTLGEFKSKLLAKVRPDLNSVYEARNIHCIRCFTKLRLRLKT